jgi:hypothetical protein
MGTTVVKSATRVIARTSVLCTALCLGGWFGWPQVRLATSQLWMIVRRALGDGAPAPAVGFDVLLVDLLVTTAAVVYVVFVVSVAAVLGSSVTCLGYAMRRRRWTRLIAGLCGLGLSLSPAAAIAADRADHHGSGSRANTAPSLNGLPMLDLPASLPSPPDDPRLPSAPRDRVAVRPGDTLWRIAAEHLPASAPDAEIAVSVARWYEHNRSTIGTDPDLIFPGMQLEQPGGQP